MAEEREPEPGLAVFRITVLGGAKSGKTSLVSAFVNNFFPTVYAQTDDPELYYKTMQLPGVAGEESPPFPVLVEVEDSYASQRKDGVDCYGYARKIQAFLDVFPSARTTQEQKRSGVHSVDPWSGFPAPSAKMLSPCCPTRMGFMLVFDANDEESLREAMRIHSCLESVLHHQKARTEPVVFLVANQADLDPSGSEFKRIGREARRYAEERRIHFAETSALELRRVRRLFRDILVQIQARPALWRPPETEAASRRAAAAHTTTPSSVVRNLVSGDGRGTAGGAGPSCKTQ